MRLKHLFYLKILAAFIAGCDSIGDCMEGTGNIVNQTRYPGDFSIIILEDDINASLIQDGDSEITIGAGKNLMDEIESSVFNNTLHLLNHNVCKWARGYEYEINANIHCNLLSRLIYKGSGAVLSTDTILSPSFEIVVQGGNGDIQLEMNTRHLKINGKSGSGDVILTGQTDTLTVNIAHAGLFDLSGLRAGVVNIRHAGTNNAFVHATKELHAHVSYIGDIYYRGNPSVIEYSRTGEGDLLTY